MQLFLCTFLPDVPGPVTTKHVRSMNPMKCRVCHLSACSWGPQASAEAQLAKISVVVVL